MSTGSRFVIILAVALAGPILPGAAQPAAGTPAPAARGAVPFAVVGDTIVTSADYDRALAVAMRKKYYHAKPPEAEFALFQREVGEEVVNRVLLLAEARRRGIQPDRDKIKAVVAGYDAQYKGSANWQANREKMLAAVVPQLESESLLDRLDKLVRMGPEPTEAVIRAFFERRKELFVEPEQIKLSVILLKVDPSSKQAVWNSALDEGKRLHKRLLAGADFAELARLHSGDQSGALGGQMDYTHRGMLPEAVHASIDKLKAHEFSEPVQLLEGVAILRLDDRRPSSQRTFDAVKERATELWRREDGEARQSKVVADLRRSVTIRIDESHYAPLPAKAEKPSTS